MTCKYKYHTLNLYAKKRKVFKKIDKQKKWTKKKLTNT